MRRTIIPFLLAFLFTALIACASLAQSSDPSTTIQLGSTVAIDGSGASADGGHVRITEAGSYVISGSLSEGWVEVDAPGAAVTLVLDGASISNPDGPAIAIVQAASATVTLADGSANYLVDGGHDDYDAALYSAASLTLNGEGALEVHAVYEGISSTEHIVMLSGVIRVWAGEDGLNANQDGVSQIVVSGGYLYVETTEGDGIDSNGTITISGGTVITQGALVDSNSGLDADGGVTITGGTVIATGSPMMGALTSTEGSQPALLLDYGSAQTADSLVVIRDEAGEELLAFAPSVGYRQLIYSSPRLQDGVNYTVYGGGTAQGESEDGLYASPVSDPGTAVAQISTDSGRGNGGWGPGAGIGGGGFPGGMPAGAERMPGGGMPRRP